MSRYLFRRRLAIVALLAAVVVLIPLIGWVSHTLALKVARDGRAPARIRYSGDATTGVIICVVESDGADVVVRMESDDGTSRITSYDGGGRPGEWEYGSSSSFSLSGVVTHPTTPEDDWLSLRPGDAVQLAKGVESDGSAATLSVWCIPDALSAGPAGIPEDDYDSHERRREAWMAAHPPVRP